MASALGSEREVAGALRGRLDAGLRQIAFWIIPSVVAFLALGDVIIAAVYQSGRFTPADVVYVWGVLAGSTLGLLASALGRLYASAYYALRDTRTPLCYALAHVSLASVLGYLFAIPLPAVLGLERRWGVAGLTVAAGLAGWVELALLRRTLNRRIGSTRLPTAVVLQLWAAAALGAAAAWGIKVALGPRHPLLLAPLVLGPYGLLYVALTWRWGVPEALALLRQVTRILGRGGQ
jgi:putative peptidoglycan lipid II flippase